MDYIIVASLLLVAFAMLLNKTFKIEITHKHVINEPAVKAYDTTVSQTKLDEQESVSLDKVIESINEIMGVDLYGNNNNPT